ncbi:hypothetical protein N7526_004390 [Penicillium atrosanguineum]|nr:hypothetical protein N7526_004390 [Penicillium atrosanguineum]
MAIAASRAVLVAFLLPARISVELTPQWVNYLALHDKHPPRERDALADGPQPDSLYRTDCADCAVCTYDRDL